MSGSESEHTEAGTRFKDRAVAFNTEIRAVPNKILVNSSKNREDTNILLEKSLKV